MIRIYCILYDLLLGLHQFLFKWETWWIFRFFHWFIYFQLVRLILMIKTIYEKCITQWFSHPKIKHCSFDLIYHFSKIFGRKHICSTWGFEPSMSNVLPALPASWSIIATMLTWNILCFHCKMIVCVSQWKTILLAALYPRLYSQGPVKCLKHAT